MPQPSGRGALCTERYNIDVNDGTLPRTDMPLPGIMGAALFSADKELVPSVADTARGDKLPVIPSGSRVRFVEIRTLAVRACAGTLARGVALSRCMGILAIPVQ